MASVTRRIPIIPTMIVLGAIAVMIGLGIWQIQRANWKHALLSRYEAAAQDDTVIAWPIAADQFEASYYRRSAFNCAAVTGRDAIAGRNASDVAGWVQIARCRTAAGNAGAVQLGWSQNPQPVDWQGGEVAGRIARYGAGVRLVADPPLAGLAANAPPDPRELPDNHMAYAFQWFFFAITALVIYFLALRRRQPKSGG